MREAVRWGAILALLLFLLAAAGYRAQLEHRRLLTLQAEHAALLARVRALEAQLAAREDPKRVLEAAREAGFVPMAEGRWAR